MHALADQFAGLLQLGRQHGDVIGAADVGPGFGVVAGQQTAQQLIEKFRGGQFRLHHGTQIAQWQTEVIGMFAVDGVDLFGGDAGDLVPPFGFESPVAALFEEVVFDEGFGIFADLLR